MRVPEAEEDGMKTRVYSDGAVECPRCGYRTPDPLDWSEMGLKNEDGYESTTTCRRCGGAMRVVIQLSYSFVTKPLAPTPPEGPKP